MTKRKYKADPVKQWLRKRKKFYDHLRNLERRGVKSISLEVWKDEICYFEAGLPNHRSKEGRLLCYDLTKAIHEMMKENIVWTSNKGHAYHSHTVPRSGEFE